VGLGIYRRLFKKDVTKDVGLLHRNNFLFRKIELYNIAFHVKQVAHIEGNIAEVGVYKGESAKVIIDAMNKEKILYLFDTFEGLPQPRDTDTYYDFVGDRERKFFKGQCSAGMDELRDYLKGCNRNVMITKGIFPKESGFLVEDQKFSFVHLDVDIYQSTYDCIGFFYPRMEIGGIILSHDYNGKGVKQAFEEYFSKEEIIPISHSQCMVIKS
jgi:hypothetical protein